jgi:hypothetical protein
MIGQLPSSFDARPSQSVLVGDVREQLATLDDESIQCVVTSPPYFGLRDYGVGGQIGLEQSPAEFIAALVGVFDGVRRVLRKDGVVFCNLGDSYAGSGKAPQGASGIGNQNTRMAGVIDPKGDKSKTTYPGEWELRDDLTEQEVAYVLRELAACKSL